MLKKIFDFVYFILTHYIALKLLTLFKYFFEQVFSNDVSLNFFALLLNKAEYLFFILKICF